MEEDYKTQYGLVGYPLGHSLSPLMHNAAFEALEVDALYKLFPLEEEELEGFFKDLKDEFSPIFGLNVTVPYKEKVVQYLDNVDPLVDKIKAVNTILINDERKLIGYNTDAPGFLAHLSEIGFKSEDKNVAILGAGGAARAIVSVLCLIVERPKTIKLYDIDKGKADLLIKDIGEMINVDIVETVNSIDDLNIELADLLINATPIGMKEDDPCLVDEGLLHSDMLVYDLIYNPAETELLRMAREKGAQVSNGLGMLYYQGVLAFQHWAGQEIDQNIKNIMREALEKGLGL
ncbi:MAG: shikimate dehydrogenase [Candidatus Omnitrophica bacterium]|nr:shikimate dehydrogenase [Candidatus Omnitrophota bacterium]MBU1997582.1 shikimate dehydrogenase [Candidatus Omnitrophota bacterium]